MKVISYFNIKTPWELVMISKFIKVIGITGLALGLAACEEYPIVDYNERSAQEIKTPLLSETAGKYVPTSLPERENPILKRFETTVYFNSGETSLDREDKNKINEIVDALELMNGNFYVTIIGHSDDEGSNDDKRDIAEKRSYAVFNYLGQKSVPNVSIILKSEADREKAVLGDSDYSDKMNRRVQIVLEPKEM